MARRTDAAPRTSAIARGAITGLTAARLGAAHLGHRLRGSADAARQSEHEAALGRILFQTLAQLRGTALKVGQLLSMDTTVLPQGLREELARSCHQALPLNRALVGRVFRQAFGQEPQALFDTFEPQAFAAASLGQVHRATLKGIGPVAVKVQYPGISATISADMRLVRTALTTLGATALTLPAPAVMNQVLEEIEATLHREVDYLQEAQTLHWFANQCKTPGLHIPRPIDSHTRAQVLTLERLEGLHLKDWLATHPSAAARDAAGQRLWDWFMECAWGHGRIHADLHPGNVLFQPSGEVGVLDFGCTRQLSAHFQQQVRRAWTALMRPNDAQRAAEVLSTYQALGLVPTTTHVDTFMREAMPLLAPMQAWQIEPFALADSEGIFDFSRKSAPPQPSAEHQQLMARYLTHVPPEMPAFERAWMGLMHLLKQLGARVDTRVPGISFANGTPTHSL